MKAIFLKEPGYTYDCISAYILKFNRGLWSSKLTLASKSADDVAFYERALESFAGISDRLMPFFYALGDDKCFISRLCGDIWARDLRPESCFNDLLDILTDTDAVTRAFAAYYGLETDRSAGDIRAVAARIDASRYDADMKYRLLSFFLDPESHLKLLRDDLQNRREQLDVFLSQMSDEIEELKNNFDMDDFAEKLAQINYHIPSGDKTFRVSLCVLARNTFTFLSEQSMFLLGSGYRDVLNAQMQNLVVPTLEQMGKVFSDRNRVTVLNILKEAGELSTTEIARRLSASVNMTFYHLSIMTDAGMLRTRTEGRSVFYRVRYPYFRSAQAALEEFARLSDE